MNELIASQRKDSLAICTVFVSLDPASKKGLAGNPGNDLSGNSNASFCEGVLIE